ncbi:MAG: sodium/proton-translocating pyrophosphatase, partial [Candidatus Diapherotrites archaeon]|nr:sodium/proton-translocating pyrophosphatase [Candidatus Diapherotrites archaeon]
MVEFVSQVLELVSGKESFLVVLVFSLIAILFALRKRRFILSKPRGNAKMKELSDLIHHGAMAYLRKQYEMLLIFIVIVAIILFLALGPISSVCFVFGAILSIAAGNIGMRTATVANSRVTQASIKSLGKGFEIAFSSGLVTGFAVVGLGLLGVTIVYLAFGDPEILFGFGFGASSIALFARVGGGIFTKGADVGADLVGKIEKGIPEDDPRNPAVIADLVGDNVGDVAGMGADLFESYVGAIVAAMVLGMVTMGKNGVIIPLAISGIGIIASILGALAVRAKKEKIFSAIDKGIVLAAVATAVLSFIFIDLFFGFYGIFYCILVGLVVAIIIGYFTEYITSPYHSPTQTIAAAAKTGAG